MRKLIWAVLYTALAFGANPGVAGTVEAAALLAGDMKKLILGAAARAVPDVVLLDDTGAEVRLAEFRGQWVVVNFWATWCAPCRAEMPSLERLAAAMPGVVVLPVATGRNPQASIDRFWAEAGMVNLKVLRDPASDLARAMAVMGLPVTVIVNPDGMEVARMIGGAEWDSPEALAVLSALMAP